MKKIIIIIAICWLSLFICGLGTDDYYTRLDALLGQTIEVMSQANSLPIVTGVISEQKITTTERSYYAAAAKLADPENNYAWTAYQNINKLNTDYLARKAEQIAQNNLGNGEKAAFLDETSGGKYLQEEQRYKKAIFFKQFKKGIGSADIYIDNILMPEKTLADLFEINLPELPDPDNNSSIKIKSLAEWQRKVVNDSNGNSLTEQLGAHWQILLEPQGQQTQIDGNDILKLKNHQIIELGIKILDDTGKCLTSENELKGYIPFVTTLPLPEGEESRLTLYNETETVRNNFTETNSTPLKGISFRDENLPPVRPGKSPLIINYSIAKNIEFIELAVRNTKGEVIYTLKESKPNPQAPIPFIWPGKEINDNGNMENNAAPGNYTISLTAYDKQNNFYSAPAKLATVTVERERKQLNLQAKKIINNGQGNYYAFLKFETSGGEQYGLEKIYVWLHGSEGVFNKPISSALYISLSDFDPSRSTIISDAVLLPVNRMTKIKVELLNSFGQPIINAPISLYSRRNNNRTIDYFGQDKQRTDTNGRAEFTFYSDLPGDAEIYALSDMIWVNKKPLIIKIRNKSDL